MKKFFRTVTLCLIAAIIAVCFRAGIFSFFSENSLFRRSSESEEFTDSQIELGSRYKNHFASLSSDQKKAYNSILTKLLTSEDAFPDRIEIPLMTGDELTKAFEAVLYDNPEIMCIGKNCKIVTKEPQCWFEPEYSMSLSTFKEYTQIAEKKAQEILSLTKNADSDFEKELIIHDYIVTNCEYDKEFYDESSTVYSCLIDGRATCEGYAKTVKYLLEKAGIECYTVIGNGTSQDGNTVCHMWNEVNIDGGYYQLDTTWDDPEFDGGETLSHIYMNITTDEISLDHSDFTFVNDCTSTDKNYFRMTDKYFTSFTRSDKDKLIKLIKKEHDRNKDFIEIKFSNDEAYDKAVKKLIDDGEAYSVIQEVNDTYSLSLGKKRMAYVCDENYRILELVF